MPNSDQPKTLDDLVFYIDEAGEDVTFYLAKDKGESSKDTDDRDRLMSLLKFTSKGNAEVAGKFSFSQKIKIKSRTLTTDCLEKAIDLTQLGNNERIDYLVTRVDSLRASAPTDDDQSLVLKALNDSIEDRALPGKSWVLKLDPEELKFVNSIADRESKDKWENRLLLEKTYPELINQTLIGRALFCLTHVSEYISVTFRKLRTGSAYQAQKYDNPKREKEKRQKRLFSISEYCEQLYEQIIVKTESIPHGHGLLVITGSTKSAKSEIARGLIHKYLDEEDPIGERRKHLVTFEDPIEALYLEPLPKNPGQYPFAPVQMSTAGDKVDFTPREKDRDAGRLRKALEDALRQTPSVFFVGETRKKSEWELLLDFASTGHLIVTTAHAGSLVEAMHKIFEARRIKTAGDRSEVANKLLGVVHLGNYEIGMSGDSDAKTNVLFPALWRRTSRGVAALTSDGLASLLPHHGSESREDLSCIGRRWLIERLLEHTEPAPVFPDDLETIKRNCYRRATEWDLLGV